MRIVWIRSGIAIHSIVSGFLIIISPLKENRSTNVARRADMLIGVSQRKNFVSNHSNPLNLMIHLCQLPTTKVMGFLRLFLVELWNYKKVRIRSFNQLKPRSIHSFQINFGQDFLGTTVAVHFPFLEK